MVARPSSSRPLLCQHFNLTQTIRGHAMCKKHLPTLEMPQRCSALICSSCSAVQKHRNHRDLQGHAKPVRTPSTPGCSSPRQRHPAQSPASNSPATPPGSFTRGQASGYALSCWPSAPPTLKPLVSSSPSTSGSLSRWPIEQKEHLQDSRSGIPSWVASV